MADTKLIRASDGVGEAVRATVTATRSIASTTIAVDAVTNWPDYFIATSGEIGADNFLTPSTVQVFNGHLSGSDIIIDSFAPGYSDLGNSIGDVVLVKPTTAWANEVADVIEVTHNEDGTLKDSIVTTAKLAEASVTSEKLNATVAFRGTTVQAIPGPSNGYDITSYTEVYDLGSDFASGVFTAPYNGVYHFDATAGATNLNGRMDCIILKGTTTQVARSQVWGNTGASDPMASCSVALSLTAGDTVKMQAGSADSAITLAAPSQFSGFLVGRT